MALLTEADFRETRFEEDPRSCLDLASARDVHTARFSDSETLRRRVAIAYRQAREQAEAAGDDDLYGTAASALDDLTKLKARLGD